ncbi:MAG: pentapeptide repeat-containing protein [Henriciella sp.]|nr:pentapeptide repeat-containing protein [Henriciella sp.]
MGDDLRSITFDLPEGIPQGQVQEIASRTILDLLHSKKNTFRELLGAASLDEADIAGGSWRNICFDGEDLRNLDFSNTDLTGCTFDRCKIRGCKFNAAVVDWEALEQASDFDAFCGDVLAQSPIDLGVPSHGEPVAHRNIAISDYPIVGAVAERSTHVDLVDDRGNFYRIFDDGRAERLEEADGSRLIQVDGLEHRSAGARLLYQDKVVIVRDDEIQTQASLYAPAESKFNKMQLSYRLGLLESDKECFIIELGAEPGFDQIQIAKSFRKKKKRSFVFDAGYGLYQDDTLELFNPVGDRVAETTYSGTAISSVYTLRENRLLICLTNGDLEYFDLGFTPQRFQMSLKRPKRFHLGTSAITGCELIHRNMVLLWGLRRHAVLLSLHHGTWSRLSVHNSYLSGAKPIARDAIISWGSTGDIRISYWNQERLAFEKRNIEFNRHRAGVIGVTVAPGERGLASWDENSHVVFWNMDGQFLGSFHARGMSKIERVTFLGRGTCIVWGNQSEVFLCEDPTNRQPNLFF